LKIPTLSPALALEQEPYIPETPYNIAQLELQFKAIKDYIKHLTKSLPSPTDYILNQLVKGCQIATNSTVLLAEENRQLQAKNKRQKKKKAKRRLYIATGGVLTVQEGLNLSQIANTELESRVASQEATAQTYILYIYSLCKSQLYTACTCPTKQGSN
jgi:hypothetical protein